MKTRLTLLLLLGAITDGVSDRWPQHRGQVAKRFAASGGAGVPTALGLGLSSVAVDTLAASAADLSGRLDINRATASELDALPGVGPVLAARILDHRAHYGAFRELNELRAVRGIGPKLFARLKDRIRIGIAR